MKKIFILIMCVFLVASTSIAMSGGGGRGHNKGTVVVNPGPHLKFTSEGALSFYIDISGKTDEAIDYEPVPEDPNSTSIALGEFLLEDGLYEVTIHGNNVTGNSEMITFDLQVVTTKSNRTWVIIPIKQFIDSDPEYITHFSDKLSITVPAKIKLPN